MNETIEERYEEIKGLDYRSDVLAMLAMTLIDDLMAERGKLKERVEELERERDMNRLDYLEAVYERDAEFCDSEMYAEMKDLRQKRKEAASDGE